MPRYAVIVDRLSDWKGSRDGLVLLTAEEFLTGPEVAGGRNRRWPTRIINLCRRYTYLSAGYYCSLLAEARSQVPMPTVADVLALARKSLYAFALPELEAILQRTMKRLAIAPDQAFSLYVFFGKPDDSRFRRLATECFDIFRYPILRLDLRPGPRWSIAAIRPLGLHQVPEDLEPTFYEAVRAFTRARKQPAGSRPPALYSLALLVDPDEKLPPSDAGALDRFIRAGQALRMEVARITQKEYRRLPEFDALFIRTTTAIDHYTYKFARKAEQEGLVVIDDPTSILRCTNKVYLHELLHRHGLPTPVTRLIHRRGLDSDLLETLEREIGYPVVLKIPDGSFSRGMYKAENRDQLRRFAGELLEQSRLIVAQEFVFTAFDWRVGVLRGEPLYVCQYMMSRNHWQIVNHGADGSFRQGGFRTLALAEAPAEVLELATRAAGLIGDGLYGVDLKQTDRGLMIVEVNDNPSIEHGVEDKVIGDALYARILGEFIRRIEEMS